MRKLTIGLLVFLLALSSFPTQAEGAEFDVGGGVVLQSGSRPAIGTIVALKVDLMENGTGWTFSLEPSYLYVNGENDTEMQILRSFMMIDKRFTTDSAHWAYNLSLGGGFGGWSEVLEGNDNQMKGFQLRLLGEFPVATFSLGCDFINVAVGPDYFMPKVGLRIVGL